MALFERLPRLEEVDFKIVKPRQLRDAEKTKIVALRRASLSTDFSERSEQEINYLVNKTIEDKFDPRNAGFPNQSFARPAHILAFHRGRLLAHLPTADNASSQRRSRPLNFAERQAKLHLTDTSIKGEPLIKHRVAWLGLCTMSHVARDMIFEADRQEGNLLDGMIAMAAAKAEPQQPMAAWPWLNEHIFMDGLERAGFNPRLQDGRATQYVYPFGEGSRAVGQRYYVAESATLVNKQFIGLDPAIGLTVIKAFHNNRSS